MLSAPNVAPTTSPIEGALALARLAPQETPSKPYVTDGLFTSPLTMAPLAQKPNDAPPDSDDASAAVALLDFLAAASVTKP